MALALQGKGGRFRGEGAASRNRIKAREWAEAKTLATEKHPHGKFASVPIRAILAFNQTGLSDETRAVFMALFADYHTRSETVIIGLDRLAVISGKASVSSVRYHLKKCRARGLVDWEPTGGFLIFTFPCLDWKDVG